VRGVSVSEVFRYRDPRYIKYLRYLAEIPVSVNKVPLISVSAIMAKFCTAKFRKNNLIMKKAVF